MTACERVLATPEPLDPVRTLSCLRRGTGDPSQRVTDDGAVWRATRTPDGPATVRVLARPGTGDVVAHAWGPGAAHILDGLPDLVGATDDPRGFAPDLTMLERLARQFTGWRVCRTRNVTEAIVAAVLEQKVTSTEAWRSWRELLWRFGDPAPEPPADWSEGPRPGRMRVPPAADGWRAIPVWEWHRAGVGPLRMRTIVRCVGVAGRLEETIELAPVEAARRMQAIPGVGVWTAAEVCQRAHGDPDAVSVGDYNLAKAVGWALVGRPLGDDGMLEVLERWRGHRYRVTRLIEMAGIRPPRRGPRLAPRNYRAF